MKNSFFEHLNKEEYEILANKGTEAPFTGEYNDHYEPGFFVCRACSNKLYESNTKFNSGCGWPSFDQAVEGAISYVQDKSYGMIRTETKCANCNSHLGHVFDDGPRETTGKRYCINSVCLDFDKKI